MATVDQRLGKFDTIDKDWAEEVSRHILSLGKLIPILIKNNEIFGPKSGGIDGLGIDIDMRPTIYYDTKIGTIVENCAVINEKEYQRFEFQTKHAYAASAMFWPFMVDIIPFLDLAFLFSIKQGYVAIDPDGDFCENSKGKNRHAATCTLFYST